MRALQAAGRPATPAEQQVLARWSGWGALQEVFERRPGFEDVHDGLRGLLDEQAWREAAANTLNAHYTDVALVEAIWQAVTDLGVTGGTVLEPGCGIGTFIGRAPDGVQMVGIELDPTTAAISRLLYPHATIRNEPFERTNLPESSFHAAVGNVPFGKIMFVDARHNPGGYSIHDAFITKTLNLVAPGGTIALITSRYSLDGGGKNQDARREWATKADLLGAVRLPEGAHRRAAGTDVVTDVLLLRRLDAAAAARGDRDLSWIHTTPVQAGGQQVEVNAYFAANPGQVLGEQTLQRGLYSEAEYTVAGDRDAGPALRAALGRVVEQASARGLADGGRAARAAIAARRGPGGAGGEPWQDAGDRPEGHIADGGRVFERTVTHTAAGDLLARPRQERTTFTQVEQGLARPLYLPATQQEEIRHLTGLRDTAAALLDAEAASTGDTPQIHQLRAQLNNRYDAYATAFGPLNRFSWGSQTRTDRKTGARTTTRVRQNPPAVARFRTDPSSAIVWALEDYDPATGHARTTDIMRHRVVAERTPATRADTPADALAIVQDQLGRPGLPAIARLLDVPEPAARQMLGTLVFDEPGTGRLVSRAEYLSGDVRAKLATARAAAVEDPRYNVNVDELIDVVPEDLGPSDIHARLGASWISPGDVQAFVRELTDDPGASVTKVLREWKVGARSGSSSTVNVLWGTGRRDAYELIETLLNGGTISVTDEADVPGGGTRRVKNATETIAAQAKADEIKDRFATWVWEDPDRAERLARVYNDRFNALALRSYDDAQLLLPGLTAEWTMRPHQLAAIARTVGEPAALLAHEVGAGKTAEMVAGAMELRRLGLARKPAVVVPNHMLEQFSREFLELYPQARILAAGSGDLTGDRRRLFVARAATGDWDAVILTQGAFKAIPMSAQAQESYLRRHLGEVEAAVEEAAAQGDRNSPTFKQLQRILKNERSKFTARVEKLRQDRGGVTWEQTGIDYLFVDEAHHYKNLALPTGDASMAVEGSDRAADLDMKLHHLRERTASGRVATFATATPISNSMGEMYVMIRYLRPDLLQAAGLDSFDAWIATFAEKQTRTEMSVDGASFKQKTRFAKFTNAPELIRIFRTFTDVKTAEDLGLQVPGVAGTPDDTGATENVVAEASPELRDYIFELGERAQAVASGSVEPTEDNMLKISSDGRKAALDMRLAGQRSDGGKIVKAADRIAAIYEQNKDRVYKVRRGAGEDADIPGALQIVFCDLSTPTGSGWNVYDELKRQLAARGVPEDLIRYVHEARNDQEKAELFAAARAGKVAVLIGSTEKMGVGTNVQNRAVALHHLDAPWRPADVAQRDGRVVRQGNQNPQVEVIRYITEGSFDGFMWGVLHRKGQFIAQALSGNLTEREFEDIGDSELSAAQAMALGSGNPLLLEKADVDAGLQRLLRLEQAHAAEQRAYRSGITQNEAAAAQAEATAQQLRAAIARRTPVDGDHFRITLDGRTYTKRPETAQALRSRLGGILAAHRVGGVGEAVEIAQFGGQMVTAQPRHKWDIGGNVVSVGFRDVPGSFTSYADGDLTSANVILRLSNRLADIEGYLASAEADARRARAAAQRARDNIGAPFPHTERLNSIKNRAAALASLLAAQEDQTEDGLATSQRLTAAYQQARDADLQLAAAAQPLARQPRPPVRPPRRTSTAPRHPDDRDVTDTANPTPADAPLNRSTATAPPLETDAAPAPAPEPAPPDQPAPAGPASADDQQQTLLDLTLSEPVPTEQAEPVPAEQAEDASSSSRGTALEEITPDDSGGDQAVTLPPAASTQPLFTGAADDTPAAPPRTLQEDAPVSEATSAPAAAGRGEIVIEHTPDGSLVFGTSRGDVPVQEALRATNWRWSRNIGTDGAWYLPRNLRQETRDRRVSDLERRLRVLDRGFVRRDTDAWRASPPDTAITTEPVAAEPAAAGEDLEDAPEQAAPAADLSLEADRAAYWQAQGQAEGRAYDQAWVELERKQRAGEPLTEAERDDTALMDAYDAMFEPPDDAVEDVPGASEAMAPAVEQLGLDLDTVSPAAPSAPEPSQPSPAPSQASSLEPDRAPDSGPEPAPDTQEIVLPDTTATAPVAIQNGSADEDSAEPVAAGSEGCWGRPWTAGEIKAARERLEAEISTPAAAMTDEQILATRARMAAEATSAGAAPVMTPDQLHERLLLAMGLAGDDVHRLRAGLSSTREDIDQVLYARPYAPAGASPAVRAFDAGMDYLGAAYQAVNAGIREAVAIGAREIAGPEWDRICRVWQEMRHAWTAARQGLEREGAAGIHPWGIRLCSAAARGARAITDLAQRWAARLETDGRQGSWAHRAARTLVTVAENVATHLRPVSSTDSPQSAQNPRVAAAIRLATPIKPEQPAQVPPQPQDGSQTPEPWETAVAELAALRARMQASFGQLDQRFHQATAAGRTPSEAIVHPTVAAGHNRWVRGPSR